jgi:hypothetical protein
MKKVLGLTLVTLTLLAPPAVAGEVFAFSQWTIKHTRTDTDDEVDYTTTSRVNEQYSSWTNSITIEGKAKTENNEGKSGESSDKFTVHRTNSFLGGDFQEERTDRVWGTINTVTNTYTRIYEGSAGIR